jgi:hypothetical protein
MVLFSFGLINYHSNYRLLGFGTNDESWHAVFITRESYYLVIRIALLCQDFPYYSINILQLYLMVVVISLILTFLYTHRAKISRSFIPHPALWA